MKKYIKEYIIKNFIKDNNRTPSQNEIILLYNNMIEENELLEDEGLLANDINLYCNANEESDYKKYNNFLSKLDIDFNYIYEELLYYKDEQINIYNDRVRNLKSFIDKYKNMEQKINFGIMLKQENDIFSYEVIENFFDLSKVDLERSNIYHLDDDKITLNVNKIKNYNSKTNEISYSIRHRRGTKIREKQIGSFNNVVNEDNKFFRIESVSRIPDDIVELIIDINFIKEKEVNELKYITAAIESNSSIQEDCYYTINGSEYIHVDEFAIARRLTSDSNIITFNNDDSSFEQKIKGIKLVLRKTAYDYKTLDGYGYHFGVDFIGYMNRKYNLSSESVLYCGPYEVLDENNNPYNFSIARIDKGTCCEIPNETSLDIYISKDNINYIKAEFNQEHNPIIHFNNNWGNAKSFEIFSIIDNNSQNEFIIESNELNLNIDESQDVFNFYIRSENKNDLDLKSLIIKRNVLNKKNNTNNKVTGWIETENKYKCKFKCSNPEGKIIDFGNSNTINIDGSSRSGKVFISYGVHTVLVRKDYFYNNVVEINIKSLRKLKDLDNFYPFNHRYLIEGFDYSNKFKGKRDYIGFEDQRGSDLNLVNIDSLKKDSSLEEYSLVEKNNNIYFIVNAFSSFGKEENFDITYRKNISENGNLLYIKSILRSNNSRKTPKIDKIQVRVL